MRKNLNEDERSALLYELALLKNASLDLVNTVISNIPSNDDSIILVLGALARNTNLTVQNIAVDELLNRLNTVLASGNIESMTTLIYALGNSGSKLAISPLLSTLKHGDIDIQISTIRSMGSHLDQPVVQQAIMTLLPLVDEDKILEEILKILIDAFENMILTNPNKELINTILNTTIKFENPNLYELLAKYLRKLKLDTYLDILKHQFNYGDLQYDRSNELHKNDSKVKRGSDWDQNKPDYNLVSSYSQRRSDVLNYPYHKGYIWGKTFGVDKMNLKVGAGAFSGVNIGVKNTGFKYYTKLIANANVFGYKINVVNMESSSSTAGKTLSYNVYLKQGPSVDKNDKKKIELGSASKKETTNVARSRQIFYKRWPIFVYVGILRVYIQGSLTSRMNIGTTASLSDSPPAVKVGVDVTLSLTLRITGGASGSLAVNHLYITSYVHVFYVILSHFRSKYYKSDVAVTTLVKCSNELSAHFPV